MSKKLKFTDFFEALGVKYLINNPTSNDLYPNMGGRIADTDVPFVLCWRSENGSHFPYSLTSHERLMKAVSINGVKRGYVLLADKGPNRDQKFIGAQLVNRETVHNVDSVVTKAMSDLREGKATEFGKKLSDYWFLNEAYMVIPKHAHSKPF